MRIPMVPSPNWTEPVRSDLETLVLTLKLITPMFGGGHTAREIDADEPVRAAAVRGHLRFWWRATAGPHHDPSVLFEEEAKRWGSAGSINLGKSVGGPGPVAIAVSCSNSGTPIRASEISDPRPKNKPLEGYMIFPFQRDKQNDEAIARTGIEFQLKVTCPTRYRAEIERAIRAWVAFGGVGARTRRGCGALTVTAEPERWLMPADRTGRTAWLKELAPHGDGSAPAHSVLTGAEYVVASSSDPWPDVAEFWARFRKGHFGTDSEGEEINYIPRNGSRWSDYRQVLAPTVHDDVPRKVELGKPYLGMPLIYQRFADAPFAETIQPQESTRMASPVILKPVAASDGTRAALVLVLNAPEPLAIMIGNRPTELRIPTEDPVLASLQQYEPLRAVCAAALVFFSGRVVVQSEAPR